MRHHALDDVTDMVPREEILPAHVITSLPVTSARSAFLATGAGLVPAG
jgi:hypothetical protein